MVAKAVLALLCAVALVTASAIAWYAALAVFVVILLCGYKIDGFIKAVEIKGRYIWLKGISTELLESLPDWEAESTKIRDEIFHEAAKEIHTADTSSPQSPTDGESPSALMEKAITKDVKESKADKLAPDSPATGK